MLHLVFQYKYGFIQFIFAARSGAKKKQLIVDKPDDDAVVSNLDSSYDDFDFM